MVENNHGMQATKPSWMLSADAKVYTKTYNVNGTYTTKFVDSKGKETQLTFTINEIDDKGPNLSISMKYNSEANVVFVEVTSDEILSSKKSQHIAYARQIAMYLIREFTNLSLPKIGQELGGRNHATILYGINAIKKSMEDNEDTKKVIDELMKNLENRE